MARLSIDRAAVPARRESRSSRRRAPVRSARLRGSSQQTLTQIDFVRYLPTEDVGLEFDDAMESPEPKRRRGVFLTPHAREPRHSAAQAVRAIEERPTERPAQGSKLPGDRIKDEIPSTPPPGCESDDSTQVPATRLLATELKANRSPLRESSVNIQANRTTQARQVRDTGIGKRHPRHEVRESCAGLAESLPKESSSRVEDRRPAGIRHESTASNEQAPTRSIGQNIRRRRDKNLYDGDTPTFTEQKEVAQKATLKHHGRMEVRDSEEESSEEEISSEPRTPAVRPAAPLSSTFYLAAGRQSSCDPGSRDGQTVERDCTVGRAPLPVAVTPLVEVNSPTSDVQPLSEPSGALAWPTSPQNMPLDAGTWDDEDLSRFIDSYDETEPTLERQTSPCHQSNSTESPSEQLHRETLQSQQLGHLPGSEASLSSQSNEDLKQSQSDDAQDVDDLDDLDVESIHFSKQSSSPTATQRHPPTGDRDDVYSSPKRNRPGSVIEADVNEPMDVDAEIIGEPVVDEDHLFDSLTASQLLPETLMRALLPMPPSSPTLAATQYTTRGTTRGTTQGTTQADGAEELQG